MSAPSVRPRRLVSFDEGLRLIRAHVGPCTPTTLPAAEALGAVLAEPAIIPADLPPQPMALRDGFAVSADTLIGASPNLPLPLAADARLIRAGETLPAGTDAVLPSEDVVEEPGQRAALADIGAGFFVAARASRGQAGEQLIAAGTRLTARHQAALSLAGIGHVEARRASILVLAAGDTGRPLAEAACRLLSGFGAKAEWLCAARRLDGLTAALASARTDAVLLVGGLGGAEDDVAIEALSTGGNLLAPALAVLPGQQAAFGIYGASPILAVPAAPEAVLALTSTIGRLMLACLTGETAAPSLPPRPLLRKIAAPAGLTRLIFVKTEPNGLLPLGSERMRLSSLAQADGLVLVPPAREGFAEGTPVAMVDGDHWPEAAAPPK